MQLFGAFLCAADEEVFCAQFEGTGKALCLFLIEGR
jgi:hypothetical protein